MLDTAAELQQRYGPRAHCPTTSSPDANGVSDMLEVAAARCKEVGLLEPADGKLHLNMIPLFETIDDLRGCGRDHGRAVLACPYYRSC